MSDGALNFPQGRTPLQELLLRSESKNLAEEIQGVAIHIFELCQQLEQELGSRGELRL
jgi:hypothetical protein